jgi:hypothetical protein
VLTSEQIKSEVIRLLGGASVAKEIEPSTLWRRLKVAKESWIGVDFCFETDDFTYLVYEVETVQIPDRIGQAANLVRRSEKTQLIIVVRDRPRANLRPSDGEDFEAPLPVIRAAHIGESITEECIKSGFGLVAEGSGRLHLIFPPKFVPPEPIAAIVSEAGHIPSWLRARLVSCDGLSPSFSRCFKDFNDRYETAIKKDEMRYVREARILRNLAEEISDLVPRFYFPLDLLEELRTWERSNLVRKRDHFFHTFNNFFAGILVLGPLCLKRADTLVPETYIRDTGPEAKLRPWEVLWPLVSLLHDPGYMSEEITTMFDYGLGIRDGVATARTISAVDKRNIRNLWDTQFAVARKDLIHLFDLVSGRWELTQVSDSPEDLTPKFGLAMGEAYFDGTKCGHSLFSGLRVITECNGANAVSQPNGYNENAAKKACHIAALSMMFHDPHTREVFSEHKIPPISFELLPYAATLVFVDALQEDRRNIKDWQFPKACIFNDIHVDANQSKVHAVMNLEQIPIKYWTGKILEFESCLAWVNDVSTTKFSIDYRSAQNLRLPVVSIATARVHAQERRRRKSVTRKGRKKRKRSAKRGRRLARKIRNRS